MGKKKTKTSHRKKVQHRQNEAKGKSKRIQKIRAQLIQEEIRKIEKLKQEAELSEGLDVTLDNKFTEVVEKEPIDTVAKTSEILMDELKEIGAVVSPEEFAKLGEKHENEKK